MIPQTIRQSCRFCLPSRIGTHATGICHRRPFQYTGKRYRALKMKTRMKTQFRSQYYNFPRDFGGSFGGLKHSESKYGSKWWSVTALGRLVQPTKSRQTRSKKGLLYATGLRQLKKTPSPSLVACFNICMYLWGWVVLFICNLHRIAQNVERW